MIDSIKKLLKIKNWKQDYRVMGYFPVKIEGYDFKLNYQHMGWWNKISNGTWEPETFEILSGNLSKDSVYCDIGAWIGPTVIYASKKCKKVICFEPDPVAFSHLTSNISRNEIDNVSSFNVALSNKTSVERMSSFGSGLGDSMTSLLPNKKANSRGFDSLVLEWNFVVDSFSLGKMDMIKMDIEGGEFKLVPAMKAYLKKYKPIVYLSLHAPLLDENTRIENLNKIIDVMSMYRICLNSDMQSVDIKDLLKDENINNYVSFVFKD